MKIIVIGGTGLLGHEAVNVALERGHEVTAMDINDAKAEEWFTKKATHIYGDVFKMSEEEICEKLKDYDALVYAVGPDDRIIPNEPFYEWNKPLLVDHCAKVFRAARKAGITKASLCSSYFLYFDRKFPEKKLSEVHPYIKVRKEQSETILREAKQDNGYPELNVYVMELPYIFGTCPNRVPLWKDTFLNTVDVNAPETTPFYFPNGGTVMTTSRNVGEALIGAIEYGKESKIYPIGNENHPFSFMIDNLLKGYAGHERPIVVPPQAYLVEMQQKKYEAETAAGKYRGLHPKYLMLDIQYDFFYYPEDEIEQINNELHLTKGNLEETIIETGKECRKYL